MCDLYFIPYYLKDLYRIWPVCFKYNYEVKFKILDFGS